MQKTFILKSCTLSVGEIETWGWFHQCFMSSFYAQRSQKGKKIVKFISVFLHLGSLLKKLLIKTFYDQLLCQYFCAQKLQSQNVTREKLHKTLSHKKAWVKCWWKWHQCSISSTNYTQVFCTKVFCAVFL